MPELVPADQQEAELIKHVFYGKLDNLPNLASKIVRIFTSSTFTDTSMERNSLMQHTYPKLKDYCREKHGLEFQVVDMRWGVRDEATDDHKTTELCMQEIDNCQRVSVGPNFVVFLGQKYGYRPLPTKIEDAEFRLVVSVSKPEDARLLNQWYKLDSNNIPSLYCLQPVSSIFTNFTNKAHPRLMEEDQSQWWETMGKLNRAVRFAAAELLTQGLFTPEDNHRYNWSVTEQEVVRGILNAKDAIDHTLAFFRHIENINIALLRHSMKFIDIASKQIDEEAQRMLSDLRDVRVPATLPASSIIRYTVEWSDEDGLNKNVHAEYLQDFIDTFYRRIVELIDQGVREQKSLSANRLYSEILQQLHVVNNFSLDFQGRIDILERIRHYIQGSSKQPLVLWGEGGCGKSSMLAKIALESTSWFFSKTCTPIRLVRFLGTTPDSSSIGPLLRSVCQQISYLYDVPDNTIPVELSQLINHFKRLLEKATADKPLCIFFDSLDQLSSADGAHSMSWMPPTLPNHAKLVVSTLPGIYNILNTLRNIIDSPENFIQIKPLGEDLAKQVLKAWLARRNRTISEPQWELVHERLKECSTPLYVKLVFDEIKLWKSYTKTQEKDLEKSVSTSINKLLGRIENQHGHILVEHALSYITASKSGLSEAELEDLISLDETVLNDVYQYHLPPIRRIPPLLWTRIRNDLPNYLVEREAEGVSVVSWYHRQFAEVSRERYLANAEERRIYHSQMADYFLGIWGGRPKPFTFSEQQKRMFNLTTTEGEADRKVPLQPLIFITNNSTANTPTVRYNLRKLSELPYQLIHAQREDDLYNHVLFNYDFIHAKLSCMPLNLCIFDYESSLEYVYDKEVQLMSDAFRLSSSVLAADPNNLACQIIGRLLPFYTTCRKIASFIDQCESTGLEVMSLVPAFNTLASPGGPLVYSLEAHQFAVYGLEVVSAGQHLLTVSNKYIVFDLSSGDIVRIIDPKIEGIMTFLAVAPDQRCCVTTTISNQYILCNLLTGEFILRDYQPSTNNQQPTAPTTAKNTTKTSSGQPADPLLGAAISNTHFAIWSAKTYQVFTNKGELLTTQTTRFQIIQIEVLEGPEIEIVCRTEDVKDDQEVARDRLVIDYCFVPTAEQQTDTLEPNHFNPSRCLTGGRKNIHSALILTRDKRRMYTCCEINDNNVEVYFNEPHPVHYKTQRIWAFDHQIYENKDRIFAFVLSDDENYLMAVIFKGFKIFSFRSYLWKTCFLPGSVRNIMSGTKRLTYTAAFSHDNRYCIACVKSTIYIFEIEWGELIASLDSHFGRILVLKCLSTGSGANNFIITTGMDKTTKVWNLKNAKEKSIAIAQLDKLIEMMHLSSETYLVLVQSRTQLCLFDIRTGFMVGQLSANPHGSIYQCTTMSTNGLFAASAESGNLVLWDVEEKKTTFVTPLKNVYQLLLHTAETMVLVLLTEANGTTAPDTTPNTSGNTSQNGQAIHAISYALPDGDVIYEIVSNMKRTNQPKKVVCTADDTYFVFIEEKKNSEVLALYDPMTGEFIHNVKLNYQSYKDITSMVPIPKQPYLVGLIDSEKGVVMNLSDKRVHITLPKWSGAISSDGKYGLYAPTRGGLEIFDFRNGKVIRTLIGKVAEGVFDVLTFFTPTNNHVIYYNKGKRTIRVFRTKDGRQIADMRCPTKVRQALATQDGRTLVVGYEDGAVQVFLIIDHDDPSDVAYLKKWRRFQFETKMEPVQQENVEKQIE